MGPGVCISLHSRAFWNFADVTLADDDYHHVGCHLDAGGAASWHGDAQWGLGGHHGGWQGNAGVAWNVEAGVCDHGGDNVCMLLGHWGSDTVIEMVVDEKDDREVHKVGMGVIIKGVEEG